MHAQTHCYPQEGSSSLMPHSTTCNHLSTHPRDHAPTQSCILAPIHPRTCASTHPRIHYPTLPLIHAPTHSWSSYTCNRTCIHRLPTGIHTFTHTRRTHPLIQYYTNNPTLHTPAHLAHLCKHACPRVRNHSVNHSYLYIHSLKIKTYPSHSPLSSISSIYLSIQTSIKPFPYSKHDPLTQPCIHACIHQETHPWIY